MVEQRLNALIKKGSYEFLIDKEKLHVSICGYLTSELEGVGGKPTGAHHTNDVCSAVHGDAHFPSDVLSIHL